MPQLLEFPDPTQPDDPQGYTVWFNGVEVSNSCKRMFASPYPREEVAGVVELFTEEPLASGATLHEALVNLIQNIESGEVMPGQTGATGATHLLSGRVRWDYR